jgi:predicted 2-oxoglutarate/Fe(II)-dependent dioxygenase YbiX
MDAGSAAPAWSPPLTHGDIAPWFEAATPTNPHFYFSTSVGRYMLLGLLPSPGPARDAALGALQAHRSLFDDRKLSTFLVVRDAASIASAQNQIPGIRWFRDGDGAVSRLYGALDGEAENGAEHPYWLVLDPSHRVLERFAITNLAGLFASLATLPKVDDYAGTEIVAPVLIVPRVFQPDLCQRLIALYEAGGSARSGVMRDIDGRTVGVLDNFKRRSDLAIEDPALRQELLARLRRCLLPEIAKVYQFEVTRIERYMVACYDAAEGGYFRPHRDDETLGTAHRKFACSINLNAEDFEGGDLRFPEYGRRTYRPPTGGAVIFACGVQHEATPVTRGRRFAFLPFFYDEAGKAIREANAEFLADPAAQAVARPSPGAVSS